MSKPSSFITVIAACEKVQLAVLVLLVEMVFGKPLGGEAHYRGRDSDKNFLLRLINNGLTGLVPILKIGEFSP